MIRYLPCFMAAACCVLTSSAATSPPVIPEHPIVGVWEFTARGAPCTETYLFKANGTALVTSGEEVAETRYEISPRAGAGGFFKMMDVVTRDNGKKDCGGSITEVGRKATYFIHFHHSGDLLLMCEQESLDTCIGPMVRVPAQDL